MRLRLASLSACAHALFKHLDMLMGTCDAFTDVFVSARISVLSAFVRVCVCVRARASVRACLYAGVCLCVCLCAGDGHGLVQKENVQMQRRKL